MWRAGTIPASWASNGSFPSLSKLCVKNCAYTSAAVAVGSDATVQNLVPAPALPLLQVFGSQHLHRLVLTWFSSQPLQHNICSVYALECMNGWALCRPIAAFHCKANHDPALCPPCCRHAANQLGQPWRLASPCGAVSALKAQARRGVAYMELVQRTAAPGTEFVTVLRPLLCIQQCMHFACSSCLRSPACKAPACLLCRALAVNQFQGTLPPSWGGPTAFRCLAKL